MKWIKAKDGSNWLNAKPTIQNMVGIIASISDDHISWYSRDGVTWDSKKDIQYWLDNGFEYCTEQEAKDLLNKKELT